MAAEKPSDKRSRQKWAMSASPSYCPVIDDENYLSVHSILDWRDLEHKRLFPEQYEDGVRVRDADGNSLSSG